MTSILDSFERLLEPVLIFDSATGDLSREIYLDSATDDLGREIQVGSARNHFLISFLHRETPIDF